MKYFTSVLLMLAPFLLSAQSSGAVLKAGLVWNDYLKDGQSILGLSQAGTTVGLEVRLGAEDKTYFKLGGYYVKMHMEMQDHPKETQFFKVKNGFEVLKALCGVETRLISKGKFNWRLSAAPAFNFVAGVHGDVKFADINGGYFGLNLGTGIDISFFSLGISVEPGFADFNKNIDNSKPVMMMLTAGFRF